MSQAVVEYVSSDEEDDGPMVTAPSSGPLDARLLLDASRAKRLYEK